LKTKNFNPDVLWTFETKNFLVRWRIEDDVLSTEGMEPKFARKCRDNVNSGEWRCFESTIEVIHSPTGTVLGEEFLGNSIYADPRKFRDHFHMTKKGHGSYFRQMTQEAIRQARKNFAKLQSSVASVTLKPEKTVLSQVVST
jgi:stalled ribosome alternative rescue factor ArfA